MTRRLTFLLALVAAGCGGSSTPTAPTLLSVTLQADAHTARSLGLSQIVGALRDGVGPERVLSIEVVANDLQDVGSIAFTVRVPGALLQGDRTVDGSFLQQGGVAVTTSGSIGGDSIRLEISRPDSAPGITGSGVVAVVDFLLRTTGDGRVELTDGEVRQPDGTVLANVTFLGGTVRVAE